MNRQELSEIEKQILKTRSIRRAIQRIESELQQRLNRLAMYRIKLFAARKGE